MIEKCNDKIKSVLILIDTIIRTIRVSLFGWNSKIRTSELSWSLVKGCVTKNPIVPLISWVFPTVLDRSGHFLILLSRDSRDKSYLTFQKMHFPPFFVSNPKEFSREVRLSLHQMSRTHSDWWMTLANSLWVSPYFDWVVVVKSGEQ